MPKPSMQSSPLCRTISATLLALSCGWASAASPVVADVNGSATPGDFVFGPATIGWEWTAPLSFFWDGLGSTFHSCCQFNVLSPSQATLLIATDNPSSGGTTLFSGQLDSSGHASFATGISVTAGTRYFIGLKNLTGNSPFAVGVNIANWVPAQAPGTVNLSGWYTGANFETFFAEGMVNGVEQQPFSAPILRFEGLVSNVPEPGGAALWLLGLGLLGAGYTARHDRQRPASADRTADHTSARPAH